MAKIKDFKTQTNNANLHTERGKLALSKSIDEYGWIGAITVANNNETFDGSARLESIYSDDAEPIIIDSDGTRPIIVRRTDIEDTDDPKAKMLAISANRIAQIDLEWDADILASLSEEIDLSGLFTDDELIEIIGGDVELELPNDLDYSDKNKEIDTDNLDSSGTFKFTFEYAEYLELIAKFNEYKSDNGITDDNEAFAKLLNA